MGAFLPQQEVRFLCGGTLHHNSGLFTFFSVNSRGQGRPAPEGTEGARRRRAAHLQTTRTCTAAARLHHVLSHPDSFISERARMSSCPACQGCCVSLTPGQGGNNKQKQVVCKSECWCRTKQVPPNVAGKPIVAPRSLQRRVRRTGARTGGRSHQIHSWGCVQTGSVPLHQRLF